ncbi:MAG: hypothetical protein NTX56_04680 [Proteobacteria bacterium]|nr:hypothetical protein [Pseudomonadota bacterium]
MRSALVVFVAACLLVDTYSLAGEILIAPQQGDKNKSSSASEQRERAKSYRKDDPVTSSTTIVLPEEESDGALSPRGNAAEGRARDNRARARETQREADFPFQPILIKPDAGTLMEGGSQERARDNRARASGYSRGEHLSAVPGRVGADGIPLVICKDRDNVAGQIGDDLKSGSVIVILREGKQVKVRCQ